jgi:hypothetical protein
MTKVALVGLVLLIVATADIELRQARLLRSVEA